MRKKLERERMKLSLPVGIFLRGSNNHAVPNGQPNLPEDSVRVESEPGTLDVSRSYQMFLNCRIANVGGADGF
jgi:hypothetical protein